MVLCVKGRMYTVTSPLFELQRHWFHLTKGLSYSIMKYSRELNYHWNNELEKSQKKKKKETLGKTPSTWNRLSINPWGMLGPIFVLNCLFQQTSPTLLIFLLITSQLSISTHLLQQDPRQLEIKDCARPTKAGGAAAMAPCYGLETCLMVERKRGSTSDHLDI